MVVVRVVPGGSSYRIVIAFLRMFWDQINLYMTIL